MSRILEPAWALTSVRSEIASLSTIRTWLKTLIIISVWCTTGVHILSLVAHQRGVASHGISSIVNKWTVYIGIDSILCRRENFGIRAKLNCLGWWCESVVRAVLRLMLLFLQVFFGYCEGEQGAVRRLLKLESQLVKCICLYRASITQTMDDICVKLLIDLQCVGQVGPMPSTPLISIEELFHVIRVVQNYLLNVHCQLVIVDSCWRPCSHLWLIVDMPRLLDDS